MSGTNSVLRFSAATVSVIVDENETMSDFRFDATAVSIGLGIAIGTTNRDGCVGAGENDTLPKMSYGSRPCLAIKTAHFDWIGNPVVDPEKNFFVWRRMESGFGCDRFFPLLPSLPDMMT